MLHQKSNFTYKKPSGYPYSWNRNLMKHGPLPRRVTEFMLSIMSLSGIHWQISPACKITKLSQQLPSSCMSKSPIHGKICINCALSPPAGLVPSSSFSCMFWHKNVNLSFPILQMNMYISIYFPLNSYRIRRMSEKCDASRVPTRDCTPLRHLKRLSLSLIRFSSHLPLIWMDVFGVCLVWTLRGELHAIE